MYLIVPSKHPWALGIHGAKIRGGRLHGEAIHTYNVHVYTLSRCTVQAIHEEPRIEQDDFLRLATPSCVHSQFNTNVQISNNYFISAIINQF